MAGLREFPFQISYGPSQNRLRDFYLPALERSVRYDRLAGYFSSGALAVAAAGIVRLIANGGRMRLLVGARLSESDVRAVQQGEDLARLVEKRLTEALPSPEELRRQLEGESLEARLRALSWMVAHGTAQIRVVLPRGPDGYPIPAPDADEYFHPKEGVFEDSEGHKLSFSGSSNESAVGWLQNYETFMTFASWERKLGSDIIPIGAAYIAQTEARFRELWEANNHPDWIALDLPKAARERLLEYCPDEPPHWDPGELAPPASLRAAPALRPSAAELHFERLRFRFLLEAPFLRTAEGLGIETSAVAPWPHQTRVVLDVVRRYPQNFLFCDEVGLGKTIEVGLVLRQLVISARVRRALLLVPASILKQWQEELYEKCVLSIPRLEGDQLVDVFDRGITEPGANVWNSVPILLASSQLVKRRDRREELLSAEPWDLVIVDEAHHARRKSFSDSRYRPNRLLELLAGVDGNPGLKDRTRCLYLLTATPMQVHPMEVWDLLRLLGMGGRWGAVPEHFLRYFEELEKPASDRDWHFLMDMVSDANAMDPSLERDALAMAQRSLKPVECNILRGLPRAANPRAQINALSDEARGILDAMLRSQTPLRTFMKRHTRTLLRRYREKGILKEKVPSRAPEPVWIAMREDERKLYDRLDEYFAEVYQTYESQKKGLGFVMTVYRRRLTSSFYAVLRSLERRREFLLGRLRREDLYSDEDLEQADLSEDIPEEMDEDPVTEPKRELHYVEDFLRELRGLGEDSKLVSLRNDLDRIFHRRDKVIVFTQYTDTLDYLREKLREIYGTQVACYSGRGGEVWNGMAWVPIPKEVLKEEFRIGEQRKILLCTDAASEGLNLQTCGVLVNFDMPWNPMRVEQRIGRIDRIGQVYDEIWVRNYFYEQTVEALVFHRLRNRIHWFEAVVGQLQPILHQVEKTIQNLAMARPEARGVLLQQELQQLERTIEAQQRSHLNVESFVSDEVTAPLKENSPPVTLSQIEDLFLSSPLSAHLFTPHPKISGAYWLRWGGEPHLVTFSPGVFDLHPNSVQLLSYGNPLFQELLNAHGSIRGSEIAKGVAVLRLGPRPPVTLFLAPQGEDGIRWITDFSAYEEVLRSEVRPWTEGQTAAAREKLAETLNHMSAAETEASRQRREAERLALKEAARQILLRTAYLYQREWAQTEAPALEMALGAVKAVHLSRLGQLGAPYRGLLSLLEDDTLEATTADLWLLQQLDRLTSSQRKHRIRELRAEGMEVLRKWKALGEIGDRTPVVPEGSAWGAGIEWLAPQA